MDFEACSGFTRVTARWIARPPEAAFVTRLRPVQLPVQAAREASIDLGFESSRSDSGGEWQQSNGDQLTDQYKTSVRHLTQSFLHLAELDSRAFERLNRYEVAL
jgi:hypothetical protein